MTISLPLVHRLEGAPCLVVGAGVQAARKAQWLALAGAKLTVVAPKMAPAFDAELQHYDYAFIERDYAESDLTPELTLVVCATNNRTLNAEIFNQAKSKKILVNCVDDPEHCTITFPAIVNRDPLLISISTGGAAPAVARTVRGWIEERLPLNLGDLLDRISSLRNWFKSTYPDIEARTHAYNRLLSAESLAAIPNETDEEVLSRIEEDQAIGKVTLVGAGPGDPDLITLKGLRALQTADVVFYDQLANVALLEYTRRDADRVYVGKQGPKPGETPERKNNRSTQQQTINEQILAAALEGRHVVRLKGGDPFIYGRGGEELDILAAAGVEVSVVPGITAALGAASYAGIPLTHRDYAQSIRFVTGHRVENAINLDWPELGKSEQTLVVYMGLVGLAQIAAKLIEFGAPPERPVALVERATLPEQRTVFGTLQSIAQVALDSRINGPTVAIVGDVVTLAIDRGTKS